MKNLLKNIILLAIIALSFANLANSASFRIVRTDVDSTLSDFVTAKYMFSFDIYLDDIEYCNNVSFQLKYDNASIIDYDGHIQTNFSRQLDPYTLEKDSQTDIAFLNISTYTGESIENSYFPNPRVLTLQFVVTPTAENGKQVTFEFTTALATTLNNGESESIVVDTEPVIFDIHGFVDVLPGNADNDPEGFVNAADHVKIALYKGIEKRFPGARFFKRENASTGKYLQKCLVWDIADATYADCNGDGTITIGDAVVVALNFDDNQISEKQNSELQTKENIFNKKLETQTSISLPIYAESYIDYNSAFGKIILTGGRDYKILGVQAGNLFTSTENIVIDDFKRSDENDSEQNLNRELEFFIMGYDSGFKSENSGELVKIILDPGLDFIKPEIIIDELNGISLDKNIFELGQLYSSVNIADENISIIYGNSYISLFPLHINDLQNIKLYNAFGNNIDIDIRLGQEKLEIDTSSLFSGVYILTVQNDSKLYSYKLIITK
jgi:Secretion system C-terminal sorting domain